MEKKTPHCPLPTIKVLVDGGRVRTTATARIGASELGLDFSGMLDVIMALTTADFLRA